MILLLVVHGFKHLVDGSGFTYLGISLIYADHILDFFQLPDHTVRADTAEQTETLQECINR